MKRSVACSISPTGGYLSVNTIASARSKVIDSFRHQYL
jgi:hypothetical protein